MVLVIPVEGESLDDAVADTDKPEKEWEKLGVAGVECQHKRQGAHAEGGRHNRPLHLTIPQKDKQSRIFVNAKILQTIGEKFSRIFVKKGVHPGVRKEWQRLREVEVKEKERPEIAGCYIKLDTLQRKVYRHSKVIDTWNPQFL